MGTSPGGGGGGGSTRSKWAQLTSGRQGKQKQPEFGAPMTPGGAAGGVGAPVVNAGRPSPGVPAGTTTLPGATTDAKPVQQTFYADPSKLPIGGGYTLPTAGPGMLQGAGLNWTVPPPPPAPSRNILATLLSRNPRLTGAQRNSGGGGGYTTSGRGAGGNASSARSGGFGF